MARHDTRLEEEFLPIIADLARHLYGRSRLRKVNPCSFELQLHPISSDLFCLIVRTAYRSMRLYIDRYVSVYTVL